MITASPLRAAFPTMIATATRAPSVHNTQPWHWCLDGERLSLFADHERQLLHADPDGRDLVISCGAALNHLQVAAAAAGWATRIQRMPNPDNDRHLAIVSFSPAPATPADAAALLALLQRRTDRRRPASSLVARERLDELLAVGHRFAVAVTAVVSHEARIALLRLLAEADYVQRESHGYVDEITNWTARTGPEGIPQGNLAQRRSSPDPLLAPSRFPSGTLRDRGPGPHDVPPALLAICTSSDDTGSRLRAGEALSAILLRGTSSGLAMVPLSQTIEVDHTRRLLQDELLGGAACPQIIVQVGMAVPNSPKVPLTPRLPLSEVTSDVEWLPPRFGVYHAGWGPRP